MLRTLMTGLLLIAPVADADVLTTSAGPVDVTPVVRNLDTPWAVAFLPDGGVLITERGGQLLRIGVDGNRRNISGVPEVRDSGQGGLLDVVLDPDFADTRVIYLSYAEPVGMISARTAIARAVLIEDRLEKVEVLFRQQPDQRGGRHFGSRIVPDGKGGLYVTLGDRGQAARAQDPDTSLGKVVRLSLAPGERASPRFAGEVDVAITAGLWSIGHRNPQGAALDETGQLWTVSHGARGGDEVNRPQEGRNYGWPVISYGTHYSGERIGEGTHRDGMEQPVWYWDPSIAPSGMMIYSGTLWPDWTGDIFVGSLKYDLISRLDRDGQRIEREERLFAGRFGRIRDIREAPDGAIWFIAEADGVLYRMVPAE